jgi:hypothetical protein
MGTSNFYYENILAVIPDSENETFDDYELEYFEDCIFSELNKYYKDKKLIYLENKNSYKNNYPIDRNFGGKIINRLFFNLWNNDEVFFEIIIYHGYYAGLNIDYCINYHEHEYDEEHLSNHRSIIKAEKLIKNIIRKFTDEYKVSYRFSNGETGYEKVNENEN